jgi:ribosomal protein S18 acetylase RimI-like enzyme
MAHRDFELVVAGAPADYRAARRLFEDYAGTLGVDLCFQNFSVELDRLEDMYGPPMGRLILARQHGEDIGCVGVRPLDGNRSVCEMKRLYVRPAARGLGAGRALAAAAIDAGRDLGYQRMVLDTLLRMTEALALYRSMGFRDIGPYYSNPNDDVCYLERLL